MRLITTMLALLLASSGAWADWVKVHEDDEKTYYLDPASIRKDANLRKVWVLQDFKNFNNLLQGLSQVTRKEYDCKNELMRILFSSLHTHSMGTGKTVGILSDEYLSKWIEIPPRSYSAFELQLVCVK